MVCTVYIPSISSAKTRGKSVLVGTNVTPRIKQCIVNKHIIQKLFSFIVSDWIVIKKDKRSILPAVISNESRSPKRDTGTFIWYQAWAIKAASGPSPVAAINALLDADQTLTLGAGAGPLHLLGDQVAAHRLHCRFRLRLTARGTERDQDHHAK